MLGALVDPSVGNFRQWMAEFKKDSKASASDPAQLALLERGKKLAEQRRVRIARLIRENPEQALKEALSLDEYESLPEGIRALVEKPFSAKANYRYYPICGEPDQPRPVGAPDHLAELDLPDGTTLDAYTFGQRSGMTSKRGMPVQGVMLDGAAAIQDGVFRQLSAAEVPAAMRLFGNSMGDVKKSMATGNLITGEPVYANAGPTIVAFANQNELVATNNELAKSEAPAGPYAGSNIVYSPVFRASGGLNVEGAIMEAQALSQAWTTSKKKYFMIRIDFSDAPGALASQSDVNAKLNGPVTDMIREMSYGKAWIEATVSANVYRLPNPSSYYADTSNSGYNTDPAFSSKMNELLRDARNNFRTTKSGADAGINIGPVNNTGSGGYDTFGNSQLGDYDIVGISFAPIGMKSGGGLFSGLATLPGGDAWFQGYNDESIYTHETCHNYGVDHASYWKTTDNSVVGAGYSFEYGDAFDVMGTGKVPQAHLHPQAKARLSWIDGSQWADANASGTNAKTYRIYREDSSLTTGAARGVRITKASTVGSEEYYWLGYRGLYPANPHVQRGAYLTWQRPGQTRCWLLDTTPLTDSAPPVTGDKSDAPLDLGRTYADSTANVFLTPVAVGGSGADQYVDMQVNIGPFSGNQPPSALFSGSTTVPARTSVTFTVNASDPNGDTLAYYWDTHDGTVNNNCPTLTHTWPVGGTYTVNITVSDMKGGSTSLTQTITVTDPATTWTNGSVGTSDILWDVVYAKGRFLAADYSGAAYVGGGAIYLSWDGITWTTAAKPPLFDSEPRFAFGNNVFVMGAKGTGGGAQIAYSTDGSIWTTASFPSGVSQIRDVAFGNGKFVAVADAGDVLSSTDGITWNRVTVSGLPNFRHLVWDGTAWIATVMNAAQTLAEVVWTSGDAVNWTQRCALGVSTLNVYAYAGTAYAIGVGAGVRYSTDHGVTWQAAQMPGDSHWTTFVISAADDGTLLCTAGMIDNTSTTIYAVLVSADGRTWSRTSSVLSGDLGHNIAFGGGKFVTVEDGGVTHSTGSFYPANAAPVVSLSVPATAKVRELNRFTASATDANGDSLNFTWDFGSQTPMMDGTAVAQRFLLSGTVTYTLHVTDGRGGVATSTQTIIITDPARNFTQRSSSTTSNLTGIATDGNVAVAVGGIIYGSANALNGYPVVILSSTDGSTWTKRSVPTYSSGYADYLWFSAITWDGSRFIAVGGDYNYDAEVWGSTIYTSPDGTSWTQKYIGTTDEVFLQAVAGNGQSIVAVGDAGTVLTSTNTTTWTKVSITGAPTTISGIAYGGGTYVITGYSGSNGSPKVFTSTDGLTWTDRSSGLSLLVGADVRKIAWLNDRFVASGWYSKLLTSINLGQTFTTTRSAYEDMPALAYGDNLYFGAGGIDPNNTTTKVDVLSTDGITWCQYPAPALANPRTGAAFFKHTFLTVGNGGQIWQSDSIYNGFGIWQSANFPNGGLCALADGDADWDGVLNLTEYALNRNPNSGVAANGRTGAGTSVIQSNRLRLHLDMPDTPPSDVNYVIQGVSDLTGTWTELARKNGIADWQWLGGGTSKVYLGTASGGRIPTEIGMPDSAGTPARYFLRLKVERP